MWGIFCPIKSKDICNEFITTIQQCVSTFAYPLSPPSFHYYLEIVYLEGSKFSEYKNQLSIINPQV